MVVPGTFICFHYNWTESFFSCKNKVPGKTAYFLRILNFTFAICYDVYRELAVGLFESSLLQNLFLDYVAMATQ